jgi:hypothetical protein
MPAVPAVYLSYACFPPLPRAWILPVTCLSSTDAACLQIYQSPACFTSLPPYYPLSPACLLSAVTVSPSCRCRVIILRKTTRYLVSFLLMRIVSLPFLIDEGCELIFVFKSWIKLCGTFYILKGQLCRRMKNTILPANIKITWRGKNLLPLILSGI